MEEINKTNIFVKRMGKKKGYYTKSLYPKYRGFAERIDRVKGEEYREVMPERSKLIAAVAKGLSQTGLKAGHSVLYLGASHGYTPSFVSDIVGSEGVVYCLDFAPRVIRDLVFVCEDRKNMLPLFEDAARPERYEDVVPQVDIVYQDIAQRNQLEIFLANCNMYLKQGGFGLLALKARSIDVSRKPGELFSEIERELAKKLTIVDKRKLDPFEKDHAFFVVKKK